MPTLGWERAYRSGDLVRTTPRACSSSGRADEQVKLGGRRIELGEVDAALQALPDVTGAAAAVSTTAAGNQVLVGYLVAPTRPRPAAATERCASALPAALVPLLAIVDDLPTRTSGKVDRAALPWPLPGHRRRRPSGRARRHRRRGSPSGGRGPRRHRHRPSTTTSSSSAAAASPPPNSCRPCASATREVDRRRHLRRTPGSGPSPTASTTRGDGRARRAARGPADPAADPAAQTAAHPRRCRRSSGLRWLRVSLTLTNLLAAFAAAPVGSDRLVVVDRRSAGCC